MESIGIDVAKATLEVALNPQRFQVKPYRVPNNPEGFAELLAWVRLQVSGPLHFVLEATGPYHLAVATWLYEQADVQVSVVNPLKSKLFWRLMDSRAKTDAVDSQLLALFGVQYQPPAWAPPSESLQQLRQWINWRNQRVNERTQINNHLKSLRHCPVQDAELVAQQEQSLARVKQEIVFAERKLLQLAQAQYPTQYEFLTSIPGIGKHTAVLLLYYTQGFTRFENIKQLAAYVGLAPGVVESGQKKLGSVRLIKRGVGPLRKALYMAAMSSKKYNASCKALYERLTKKGKSKMTAMLAVAHKLLRQAFGVVMNGKPYSEENLPILTAKS